MKKFTALAYVTSICSILSSCADHDDPKLSPIETSHIKRSATVKDPPNTPGLNTSEEMTVDVNNVVMSAPKGVVLKSISLVANNGTSRYEVDEKPYSGEPLEFKVPLTGLRGRLNFSLRGNLIKKDSRDAEIIIADNIQKIIFSEAPEFECTAKLFVTVKSTSTTGEEYSNSFEACSADNLTIPVPQNELYWQPTSGTASTLEVSLGSSALAWSPNTTFDSSISKISIGHSSGETATLKITIPNTPGSLNSEKLQMYVIPSFYGTWENITIEPYSIIYPFSIIEEQ